METIVSEKRTKAEILRENPKMTAINYLYDK
jgi:hypothetical protein